MIHPLLPPNPKFQTNISLYQIFVALAVGLVLQPLINASRLLWRYHGVSGAYFSFRDLGNGKLEPTGGRIQIKFKWWPGFHSVEAFHHDGSQEWKGEMHLSLDMTNVGSGVFWHVDQSAGAGDQKFRYFPEKKRLEVQGTTFKVGNTNSFFHVWIKEPSCRPAEKLS
jgi:hypothetical protein